jgi:large subunit ribosomal protein L10
MAKTRAQKETQLKELERLLTGKAVVLTQYTGLGVKELQELRSNLRKIDGKYSVTKNSLLRIATKKHNLSLPEQVYSMQLGIAVTERDEVEANRQVVDFAKSHQKIEILGALINGEFVDPEGVKSLAALPSRDELLAQLVGSISAPISGLVNVMSGNLRGLVNVIKQYHDSKA